MGRGGVQGTCSATAVAAELEATASVDGESVDLSSRLELQNIRESLIRQEDTIIFSIIERAQVGIAANAAPRPCKGLSKTGSEGVC